jgi:hypothetical protein
MSRKAGAPRRSGGDTGKGAQARKGRGDGGGRLQGRAAAPLEGSPTVEGASGPDLRLNAVAERYAQSIGVDLRRQDNFAEVDPEFAARITDAYDQMKHAPTDPAVKEAYENLIRQTAVHEESGFINNELFSMALSRREYRVSESRGFGGKYSEGH